MKTVVSTSVLAAILSGCATHITPVIESGHEGVDEAQARGLADHYFVASDLEPSALHGLTRQQRHQSIRQGCSLDFYTITESLPQNLRWELRESVLASGHFGTYRRFVSDSTFNQGSYEIPGHLAADLAWFAEEFERTALMPLLLIIGHTNSDGGVRFNQSLSEKRAAAVYTFLIERGCPLTGFNGLASARQARCLSLRPPGQVQ